MKGMNGDVKVSPGWMVKVLCRVVFLVFSQIKCVTNYIHA